MQRFLLVLGLLLFADVTWPQVVISPTQPPQTFNVANYGAVCNGVADDTIAIQAAVTAWKAAAVGIAGQNILSGPGLGKRCKVTSPIDFTNTLGNSSFTAVVRDLYLYGVYQYAGPIGTLGTVTQGTAYTNGTYNNVPLTGGSGSGCTAATIVISGTTPNQVWTITLSAPGCGINYATDDVLSVAAANVGGTGSGFSAPVQTLSGGAVIDAIGSRFVQWDNVVVEGDCTSIPNALYAIGRYNGISADYHWQKNLKLLGCWQFAAYYNLASETGLMNGGLIYSTRATGHYFGAVMDGMNHFNWSSTFKAYTMSIDTGVSFLSSQFSQMNVNLASCATCTPWWIGRALAPRWENSYSAGIGTCGVILYSASNGTRSMHMKFDMHFETAAMTNAFCLQGTDINTQLLGFEYTDPNPLYTGFVLNPAANIASINALGVKIKTISMNAAAKVYGTPAIWSVTPERIEVPAAGNYTAPTTSRAGGQICIGFAACTGS